ncbi:MAG: hypothetical protein JSV90_00525 [Methanobacteriota archaeon]|nr:MAG: hypothetical protein JSV90_00525 [Euryarchaeota archaeon]
MAEKKCPMCDGDCVLKNLTTVSGDRTEVDVCSLCGAKFPRDRKAGASDEEGG